MPPRPGSGSGAEIAPQLESVLRNLNVNLEDELTRYRRQRHGRVPPPPPPRRAAQRQTIDLISVAASASGDTTTEVPSHPATPPPPPPNPFLQTAAELENDDVDLQDLSDIEPAADEPVPEATEQADAEVDSSLPVPSADLPTDGYLESSEELLKSIAEEQTEPADVPEPYSPERKNNILLKLAGLALVLLGGVAVGFAITYPSQLQNLRSRLWPNAETSTAETPDAEAADEGDSALPEVSDSESAAAPTAGADGYQPPGPDLSTREFKELDDVKDLVTLDIDSANGSSAAPATSPLPNPAQSPLPTPTESAASPTSSPDPTAAAPTPAATPTPTTPPASPLPTDANGSNFYVIASYTGDASLNKARELVPDAFVRNFDAGARIQLAAFDNRAQAEDQVAFLTQQGITVELFGPTNE
ncbi:tat pathway signal sequence domain protein [Leptolyngbya sp. Heron Island J]|nr:tat pathway signal sequence domain protein [Leptolyngbya sp. Heron Island J]